MSRQELVDHVDPCLPCASVSIEIEDKPRTLAEYGNLLASMSEAAFYRYFEVAPQCGLCNIHPT